MLFVPAIHEEVRVLTAGDGDARDKQALRFKVHKPELVTSWLEGHPFRCDTNVSVVDPNLGFGVCKQLDDPPSFGVGLYAVHGDPLGWAEREEDLGFVPFSVLERPHFQLVGPHRV